MRAASIEFEVGVADEVAIDIDSFPISASLLAGEEASMENDNRFAMQKLDIYQAALQLARRVHEAKLKDPELRDQATRASKSAFLNTSEGLPHDQPGLRRRYFTSANGSVHETVAAIDLALAIGAVSAEDAEAIQALALRLKRMLRALICRAGG
jgi:four helix bundle protein